MTVTGQNTWLWTGVAFAGMCAVTGLGLLALSVPVACGWPLRCRRRDTKALLR